MNTSFIYALKIWFVTSICTPMVDVIWAISTSQGNYEFTNFSNFLTKILIIGLVLTPVLVIHTFLHGFIAGINSPKSIKRILHQIFASLVALYFFAIFKPTKISSIIDEISFQSSISIFLVMSTLIWLSTPEMKTKKQDLIDNRR